MCDEMTCPRCGSADVISYGKTEKKRLRRKCNACVRTFSLTAGTVMFSRKPKIKKLRAMVSLMLNDRPFRTRSRSPRRPSTSEG